MTDHIERTTFDDLAGREVTWADPAAPHQITVNIDMRYRAGEPSSGRVALIGCTCGAQRVRQAMEAPIAEMWLAYNTLDHLDRAEPLTLEAL
jgi:hypothetical protein